MFRVGVRVRLQAAIKSRALVRVRVEATGGSRGLDTSLGFTIGVWVHRSLTGRNCYFCYILLLEMVKLISDPSMQFNICVFPL